MTRQPLFAFDRLTQTPVVYALIILVSVAIYFQSLSYPFTLHDDDTMISLNMEFIGDASNLGEAFLTDAWCEKKTIELYRPLQTVTYILDAQTSSDVAYATHRTNLMIHILCCFAVFHLLVLLGFGRGSALAGALVYAVHYLFSHAVIWIPARGDLLLALFSFLSMITFVRLMQTGEVRFLVLNAACFSLALFSKETAVIVPVLSLLYAWFFYRDRVITAKTMGLLAIYAVVTVGYLHLRGQSIATSKETLGISALLYNLRTIPETLAKLVVTMKYSTMPFYNGGTTLVGVAILAAIGTWFAVNKNAVNKPMMFASCWFVFFLLPSMLYRPDFSAFHYEYLDHRAYLPAFGVIVVVLGIIDSLKQPRIGVMVLAVLLPMNVLANLMYHANYASPLTFAEAALNADDRSSLAHFLHGNQLYQQGDSVGAMKDFSDALNLYPSFHEARYNRALLRQRANDMKGALEDLDILLRDKPDYSSAAWETRAILRASQSNAKGANEDFQQALRMDPQNPKILRNYEVFKSSLRADPNQLAEADNLNAKGIELAKKGQIKDAYELFVRASKLNPNDLQCLDNIGNCLHAMGDRSGACRAWKNAEAKGSRYASTMLGRFCR